MRIDGALEPFEREAVNLIDQLQAREHLAGMAGQDFKHPPLRVREAAGFPLPPGFLSSNVDSEIAEEQDVAPLVAVAAQDVAHPGPLSPRTAWPGDLFVRHAVG